MADQVPCPKTYELHGGVMALQPEHNCPPYLCCLAASALVLWLWAGKQAVYDVYMQLGCTVLDVGLLVLANV